ncbi:MAG: hypothetical protein E7092_05000 [Bacteroidales bacterium]|nr:hypothetical protein [Bacteroidales bacterium]
MEDKSLLKSYEILVEDAAFTLDEFSPTTPTPAVLSSISFRCTDDLEVTFCIVLDKDPFFNLNYIYIWVVYGDKYVDYELCEYKSGFYELIDEMRSEDSVNKFKDIIHELSEQGKVYLEQLMDTKGILFICSFFITEEPIRKIIKLPHTCTVAVNGYVFHGVEDIEEYCRMQKESSSPYILKKVYDAGLEYEDENYYYGRRFNHLYLICESKSEAQFYIRDFAGQRNFSAAHVHNSYVYEDAFPPMISYVDKGNYMILLYKGKSPYDE